LKNKIEELRNLQNLTQEDFENLMQVSRQTISSLENGKYNPSIFLAYKISKFFNLSIEDVFIFEENSEEK
jgi:putative transcriptional regulator